MGCCSLLQYNYEKLSEDDGEVDGRADEGGKLVGFKPWDHLRTYLHGFCAPVFSFCRVACLILSEE